MGMLGSIAVNVLQAPEEADTAHCDFLGGDLYGRLTAAFNFDLPFRNIQAIGIRVCSFPHIELAPATIA